MKLIDKYRPSDYCDSVSKRFRPTEALDADYLFEEMFCNFPKPVAWLFKLRDAVVKPLGLQGGGGFRNLVSERNDEEIVICSAIMILPAIRLPIWIWIWTAAIGLVKT